MDTDKTKVTFETMEGKDTWVSPSEKIERAVQWVGSQEPIAVPTVLTRWIIEEDRSVPTIGTNGMKLRYNPEFINKVSVNGVKAIMLHEVGHILSDHHTRMKNMSHGAFNQAADLALNCMLYKGYLLAYDNNTNALVGELISPESPVAGCFVGIGDYADYPSNLSAEEYYSIIRSPQQQPQKQEDNEQGNNNNNQQQQQKQANQQGGNDDDGGGNDNGDDGDAGNAGDNSRGNSSGDAGSSDSPSDGDSDNGGGGGSSSGDGDCPNDSKGGGNRYNFGGVVDENPLDESEDSIEEVVALTRLLDRNLGGGSKYSPTGLGKVIEASHDPIDYNKQLSDIEWRSILDEFLVAAHGGMPTYNKMNRRRDEMSNDTGVMFPSRNGRNKTNGVVIVDTSASMRLLDCEQAMLHIGEVLSTFPLSTVSMIQCDTKVRKSDEFNSSSFPPIGWEGWAGRGATNLSPAFKYIQEAKGEFDWCVVITDGEFSTAKLTVNPEIPVLWVIVRVSSYSTNNVYPFGKVVSFRNV